MTADCSVPSKVWGQLKMLAKARYGDLGAPRLQHIVIKEKGDKKFRYADIDYAETGSYEKILRGRKIIALKHVSGVSCKLDSPLSPDYWIDNNHHDRLAMLVSPTALAKIPCYDVSVKGGKGDAIPEFLHDLRVGQANPSPSKSPTS